MMHRAMGSETMTRHIAMLAISISVKPFLTRSQSPMHYFDLMCCLPHVHTTAA